MSEGKIILPANNGSHVAPALAVHCALVSAFGGYTCVYGDGVWKAPNGETVIEKVKVVTVAYPANDPVANAALRAIAQQFGEAVGQEAMYVRYASGEVEIFNINQKKKKQ